MQTTYMCCTVSVSTSFITVLLTELHSSQGARPGERYIVAALHSSVFLSQTLSCGFRLHRSSHQQWMDALRWSLMHRNTENATERQSCIHRGLSVTFSEDRLHRSASIHRCELGVRIVKGCHCTRIIALHYIYSTRIMTLDCIYYTRIVTTG